MKKLILLRHAKSSWSDPSLEDHDRPLNGRGKAAAPVIAAWLARQGHVPDTVLCSSARRTRQTVKRMRPALDLPEPEIDPDLYHASPDAMRMRLSRLPAACNTAMLVGHQPGLSALARMLANGRVRPGCARAYEHFPTGAAAVLMLPIADWSGLAPRCAEFVAFAKPRELAACDRLSA